MRIKKTELKNRIDKANRLMENCRLCPRKCGIERSKGKTGFCKAGHTVKIYSYRQYLGEEPPISGTKGSGVIFFTHCTMKCVYCQNFRFSQDGIGYEVEPEILCRIMLSLKKSGCHNINLVTPTHYLPLILESLLLAEERRLDIPIVYNTSGYESIEVLEILKGIVDVYLANMRYSNNKLSRIYSGTSDYVEINRGAIKTMRDQAGELEIDNDGIARRGLIIRHLVMPNLLSNTDGVLKYIASSVSKETYVSLMSQYLPLHKAREFPELSRALAQKEYMEASALLDKYGLANGWIQGF